MPSEEFLSAPNPGDIVEWLSDEAVESDSEGLEGKELMIR
jgi:hypothetical protein